ncbi:MAG: hypothetical protein ACQESG_04340, partial [Nanobdellota archaeon]
MTEPFVTKDGVKIYDLLDLLEALSAMGNDIFIYHFERGDFAIWVEQELDDALLAEILRLSQNKSQMIRLVKKRIKERGEDRAKAYKNIRELYSKESQRGTGSEIIEGSQGQSLAKSPDSVDKGLKPSDDGVHEISVSAAASDVIVEEGSDDSDVSGSSGTFQPDEGQEPQLQEPKAGGLPFSGVAPQRLHSVELPADRNPDQPDPNQPDSNQSDSGQSDSQSKPDQHLNQSATPFAPERLASQEPQEDVSSPVQDSPVHGIPRESGGSQAGFASGQMGQTDAGQAGVNEDGRDESDTPSGTQGSNQSFSVAQESSVQVGQDSSAQNGEEFSAQVAQESSAQVQSKSVVEGQQQYAGQNQKEPATQDQHESAAQVQEDSSAQNGEESSAQDQHESAAQVQEDASGQNGE